jgi:hypothetical protein
MSVQRECLPPRIFSCFADFALEAVCPFVAVARWRESTFLDFPHQNLTKMRFSDPEILRQILRRLALTKWCPVSFAANLHYLQDNVAGSPAVKEGTFSPFVPLNFDFIAQ